MSKSELSCEGKKERLRVALVTENFLPKIDGVTRTLALLLDHLRSIGHQAIICGPDTGITEYAGFPVIGTFGIPLINYPGLKLNFARPRLIRALLEFQPDVIHFADPIWFGAQMLPLVQRYLPGVPCVSSYHTNIPTYLSLFGLPFLEPVAWALTRALHRRCQIVYCPSKSTKRMLEGKGFENVRIWSRGVDTDLFTPAARDDNLRATWGCTPKPASLAAEVADLISTGPNLPLDFSPPPPYACSDVQGLPELTLPPPATITSETQIESKAIVLYVGRLSWEKNLHLLIEAYRLLPAPVRAKSKLVFVGDGPARAELTRMCARFGLDAAFMGHHQGTRLAALFASASVFAFPSYTETFGQVVLEALASGLPVVGLRAPGTADLVEDGYTGLLLSVRDSMSTVFGEAEIPGLGVFRREMSGENLRRYAVGYAALLESLICDRALRTAMGQRARVKAAKMRWWDAMDVVVKGYEELSLSSSPALPVQRRTGWTFCSLLVSASIVVLTTMHVYWGTPQ
ncbi:glycosyltransferase family 4 protein [Cylindrobasidium torrendii FP15055 ss-10]|uniref:Glycosyltransferase family 4 protein n=1 Tax=Cylindrobasidium torrendii FP15055 ss-10 TaxID=1314674 RepID=A0A0D7BAA0_9AGAR|nr:glycosyltransferase family 4 protein [Cylindrobasidium torrendii FP15055 ss-10]